jgi:iron complex outermembrane receptor protein
MIKKTFCRRQVVFAVSSVLGTATLIFGLSASVALAQEKVERVEITGSSIKRTANEGALPVMTVTRQDIEKLGVTNAEQLMLSLTANSNVGGTFTAQGAGATTYGLATTSLRGLGSNKTLVLVNGRRLANFATDGTSVDINAIPLAQIEKVEILLDGASAVYGSDAIAGVVNFITRTNFKGFEIGAFAGGSKDGGGQIGKLSLLAGWGDLNTDRYNLLLSADIGRELAIYGRQRKYSQDAWRDDGYFDHSATPSGALRSFDPTPGVGAPHTLADQGVSLGHPLSPNNCAQNGSKFDPLFGTCRYNPSPLVPLVPETSRANLGLNFRFKMNDEVEVFAEGFYSYWRTVTKEQPSPYSVAFLATDQAFALKNIFPAIIMRPSNPNYPAAFLAGTASAGQPVTVSYRATDGGPRVHTDDAGLAHMVFGAKGVVRDYDYEVAYNHNSSKVSESTQSGFQSQTALASLLSDPATGPSPGFNPFAQFQAPGLAGQIAATNFNGNIITSTLTTDALNAKVSGDLYKLPAGMARFALGASFTDENLDFVPSAAYQSGDVSGYGGQVLPISASRNSSSQYAEVIAPILKSLEGDVALRNDIYKNKTSTTPKVSLRFQPVPQAVLRAAYGKGFREPALPELFTPQQIGTSNQFLDPVTGTNGQFTLTTGGNPNLKPETSEQSSLGVVLEPVKSVSASVDFWKIRVKNLVTNEPAQFIVNQAAAGNAAFTGLVTRDQLGTITNILSTNINAGSVAASGVDVDLRWRIWNTADYGNFSTRLLGTYTIKHDLTLPDGTKQGSVGASIDPQGNPLVAIAGNNSTGGGVIFRWRHHLSFDWQYKVYGLTLTQNYQSGYGDAPRADCQICDGSEAQHVKAFQTWDVQGAYTGMKNLTVRAGIKNLTNKQPPVAITLGQYFQTGYDPSYYDPHGMFPYASLLYKF